MTCRTRTPLSALLFSLLLSFLIGVSLSPSGASAESPLTLTLTLPPSASPPPAAAAVEPPITTLTYTAHKEDNTKPTENTPITASTNGVAPSARGKFAYVMMHYEGTSKDDEYLLGLRVLIRSIQSKHKQTVTCVPQSRSLDTSLPATPHRTHS